MPRDPFAFDDYFTQDYYATVERVVFAVNDYDSLQATFTNRYDEPVVGQDEQLIASRTEWYTVGSSELWVPINDGTAFQHATGDEDKRIKSNSAYGTLLMRGMQLLGREVCLDRGDENLPAQGLYSAQLWEGLRFHWVTEGAGKVWENKRAGTSGITRGSQLPVEWLQDGPEAQTALPTYDLAGVGMDPETAGDLATLAKGLTFGEFQSKGISLARDLQDSDVRGNVMAALSEASFYETLKAS